MKNKEYKAKVALLQQAVNDPLFMADLWEVHNDFKDIESSIEDWEQQDLPSGSLYEPLKPPSHDGTK